jgi:hypothetical protein
MSKKLMVLGVLAAQLMFVLPAQAHEPRARNYQHREKDVAVDYSFRNAGYFIRIVLNDGYGYQNRNQYGHFRRGCGRINNHHGFRTCHR